MTYSLTLERGTDGSYLVWVHELPGCFARAGTREAVASVATEAIARFREWLRRVGEAVEDDEIEIVIAAEVESPISADEDTEVLVEPDRRALTVADWERVERWLLASRVALLDALDVAGADRLEEQVEGRDRTVRELLVHIAFVELMYAAWTFDLGSRDGLADFLAWTRGIASSRMAKLAERADASVTLAGWAGAPRPELWTARKALRRLIWHELLHLSEIDREDGDPAA
jgi:predicted RNase H-like HicB family nuclease